MGKLEEYVKGGKRDREESPKGKFSSKTMMVDTNKESKEINKCKRTYIAAIIRGAPRENLPYKGNMKRKIANDGFLMQGRKYVNKYPRPSYGGI